jgi:peptide/nickel transport system ATP-binding protein
VQADPKIHDTPLLEVRGLRKEFVSGGLFRRPQRVVAAGDVSFRLDRGEALALVGESGSGKSTVARLLLRLETPDGGEILLDGEDVLATERRRASLRYRGRVQMVFQDPFGSLNSVHTVGHHLERPLQRHGRVGPGGARAAAIHLLETVGLEPALEFIDRHPYELSGGQRQRVAIARALAVEPDLLVADEPTSMLDVSIRMDILNLLSRLKHERRLAILLITHDLAGARYLADRILVLFRGRIVEDGPGRSVVEHPAHPYTRALLDSIAGESASARPGRTTVPMDDAAGCPFAARCPDVLPICRTTDPDPRAAGDHTVRCHLYPTGAPAPAS